MTDYNGLIVGGGLLALSAILTLYGNHLGKKEARI